VRAEGWGEAVGNEEETALGGWVGMAKIKGSARNPIGPTRGPWAVGSVTSIHDCVVITAPRNFSR
jgi:hypothetical protein